MDEILYPILIQMGAGFFIGFAVGYALKKLIKILIVLAGLFFMLLLAMEYYGIVSIKYDKLLEAVENLIGGVSGEAQGIYAHIVAHLPFAAAFIPGFAFGVKKG
ncbi:hypothetical protein DRO02_05430 [archaeon]|nr:MAG: hypothetical protein DRO21_05930 [archaeon]RLG63983.1 MAG: hypothetical protein DRO02_05430 [archaeon]RLG66266.1 MAG: hypothetical protein DRN89_01445 [archaeon]HDM23544.1 hypothetical protein [Candidatus Bathyarchaeota archaeon]